MNSASGSANYDGIINVGASSGGSLVGYLGQLDVTVDFSADTVSGSAGNFYSYGGTFSPTAPNPLGPSVAGSLSFDGSLTGTNESAGVGGGIDGTFSGTVDGITETAGGLSGMIMGDSREGIILYLSGANLIGVGIGADWLSRPCEGGENSGLTWKDPPFLAGRLTFPLTRSLRSWYPSSVQPGDSS